MCPNYNFAIMNSSSFHIGTHNDNYYSTKQLCAFQAAKIQKKNDFCKEKAIFYAK